MLGRLVSLCFGALAAACVVENPGFHLITQDGPGSSVDPATTQASVTSSSSSGDATQTAGDPALTLDTTTAEASATDTSGVPPSTTGADGETGTDTTAPPRDDGTSTDPTDLPGEVVVPAVVATCVLMGIFGQTYLGPEDCESRAGAAGGLSATGYMVLDTAFFNGGDGRPARVYLRFDLPVDLAERGAKSATVAVRTAESPGAGGLHAGALRATGSFTRAELMSMVPNDLDLISGDAGTVEPGSWVAWDLPVELITPGASLFLRLEAIDDDGVLYHNGLADQSFAPVITITYL